MTRNSANKTAPVIAKLLRRGTKEFGAHAIGTLSETSSVRCLSTGLPALDIILSGDGITGTDGAMHGGFPMARISELYGQYSSGKTTLGCMMLANVQALGGVGIVIDTESTLTKQRAEALGVDTDSLIHIREEYIGPIFDQMRMLLDEIPNDMPCVIFWDTIAASRSKSEKGFSLSSGGLALQARELSEGLRRVTHCISQSSCAVIGCNQLKVGAIGVPFATERDTESTAGGNAIKFYSARRVRFKYAKKFMRTVKTKQVATGLEVRATVTKNKDGRDGLRCTLVMEGGRYNIAMSCLRTLQDLGAVGKGMKVAFGTDNATMSVADYEAQYNADAAFRNRVNVVLRTAYNGVHL